MVVTVDQGFGRGKEKASTLKSICDGEERSEIELKTCYLNSASYLYIVERK